MQNATAAGPSRGLLEVLFGSKAPDEGEADGQGFMDLMALIKNINKDTEETKAKISRTLGETAPGKDGPDVVVVGMPWMNMPFAMGSQPAGQPMMAAEERERLERLSAQFGLPMMGMIPMQAPAPMQMLQSAEVNEILRQKSLPPLDGQELRLLQDVNGKMALANAGLLPLAAAQLAEQKAAVPVERLPEGGLAKELAQRGIDPRKLKSADTDAASGAAPEKLISTEAFLQMQGAAKPVAKNTQLDARADDQADAQGAQARLPLASAAVSGGGGEQKGASLNAGKGRDEVELPEGAGQQAKLDSAAGGMFAAGLTTQLNKGQAASTKDVYLPGGKPDEMRNALLAEVGTGVLTHAQKGGGEMRLVIHPDDLGEVKLKVSTKGGKVEVHVVAQNDDVAKLIRGGSKELESSLRDQNLSLAKLEVSVSDSSSVASTDTRSNLTDQFLSQSQHHGGLSHGATGDEGRSARWGGEQGGRQGPAYGFAASEESGRGAPAAARSSSQRMARDGSRRLDVVA